MQAASVPGVRFAGASRNEGHLLGAWPEDEKERQIREALGGLVGAAETIRGAGIEVPIVTAGRRSTPLPVQRERPRVSPSSRPVAAA